MISFKQGSKPLEGSLIAADMDGTLVDGDTLFDFFSEFGMAEEAEALNRKNPSSDVSILLDRIAATGGISMDVFNRVANRARFFPGAVEFLKQMQQLGANVCLLTASYEPVALRVANRLQLQNPIVRATKVRTQNGKVTGFAGPLMEGLEKRRALESVCQEFGFSLGKAIGLADSELDRDFMTCIQRNGGRIFWKTDWTFSQIQKKIDQRLKSRTSGVEPDA